MKNIFFPIISSNVSRYTALYIIIATELQSGRFIQYHPGEFHKIGILLEMASGYLVTSSERQPNLPFSFLLFTFHSHIHHIHNNPQFDLTKILLTP